VVDTDTIEVTASTPEQVGVTAAKLGIPIFESRLETSSLEDVFFRLTSHPAEEGRTP
jgi:ABC-2 type transport system ATP-binding protein